MRSTIFDSSANENTAAAVMLNTPAMVVASRMEMRIGSIFRPRFTNLAIAASRALYRPGRLAVRPDAQFVAFHRWLTSSVTPRMTFLAICYS
jgi:hypothetical protein